MKDLLKPFGGENDQAYHAILNWCNENRRRVNSTELSLLGFKHYKKGQRIWVLFSPSCIERKARKLAEWKLLDRGYDSSHHAWYCWPQEQKVPEKVDPSAERGHYIMRDGMRLWRQNP